MRALLCVAMLGAALLGGGCAGSTRLLSRGHAPGAPGAPGAPRVPGAGARVTSVYLERLGAEQARLARDETALPARPRTPAELARSVGLLARAIDRLATGLQEIAAPPGIRRLHRQLVAVAARYRAQLAALAPQVARPEREVAAANALAEATRAASDDFTATFALIRRRLGR